jgi:hypothetical protein
MQSFYFQRFLFTSLLLQAVIRLSGSFQVGYISRRRVRSSSFAFTKSDMIMCAEKESRRLTWRAAAKGSVRVKEESRTAEEYMRLPASEYSVLSASQITRLTESEFRFDMPTMNFFGTKIQPILYVDVNVIPEQNKSEIIVRRAETIGSETALKGIYCTYCTPREAENILHTTVSSNLNVSIFMPLLSTVLFSK